MQLDSNVPSFDDNHPEQIQENNSSNNNQQSKYTHPITIFFTLFFKVSCLIIYLFLTVIFSESFIITFIVVVLLLAFDFYVMKNVSGRLLVGLRWWNEIKEDGESVWRFESKEVRSTNQRKTEYHLLQFIQIASVLLFGKGMKDINKF